MKFKKELFDVCLAVVMFLLALGFIWLISFAHQDWKNVATLAITFYLLELAKPMREAWHQHFLEKTN